MSARLYNGFRLLGHRHGLWCAVPPGQEVTVIPAGCPDKTSTCLATPGTFSHGSELSS